MYHILAKTKNVKKMTPTKYIVTSRINWKLINEQDDLRKNERFAYLLRRLELEHLLPLFKAIDGEIELILNLDYTNWLHLGYMFDIDQYDHESEFLELENEETCEYEELYVKDIIPAWKISALSGGLQFVCNNVSLIEFLNGKATSDINSYGMAIFRHFDDQIAEYEYNQEESDYDDVSYRRFLIDLSRLIHELYPHEIVAFDPAGDDCNILEPDYSFYVYRPEYIWRNQRVLDNYPQQEGN